MLDPLSAIAAERLESVWSQAESIERENRTLKAVCAWLVACVVICLGGIYWAVSPTVAIACWLMCAGALFLCRR